MDRKMEVFQALSKMDIDDLAILIADSEFEKCTHCRGEYSRYCETVDCVQEIIANLLRDDEKGTIKHKRARLWREIKQMSIPLLKSTIENLPTGDKGCCQFCIYQKKGISNCSSYCSTGIFSWLKGKPIEDTNEEKFKDISCLREKPKYNIQWMRMATGEVIQQPIRSTHWDSHFEEEGD